MQIVDKSQNRQGPYQLTIGAVAQAAGISVETLRTWERRYGLANHARRDEGGQRRYAEAEVKRLRLVRQALGAGHRAASVVPLPESALRELLQLTEDQTPGLQPSDAWLSLVEQWDWQGLSAKLTQAAAGVSATQFLDNYLGPFLTQVGTHWALGKIDVAQEHLTSECVMEFLSRRWAALHPLNSGRKVVLTTLPRERHTLGLHMAAWALATAGARLVFLGADTPITDIGKTVVASEADHLVVSASQASDSSENKAQLAALLAEMPPHVHVIVGGEGFRDVKRSGVTRLGSFTALVKWFSASAAGERQA